MKCMQEVEKRRNKNNMKRSLNPTEQQQLRILKAFHKKRLRNGFKWKTLLKSGLFIFGFAAIIYFLNNHEISWVGKIGLPFTLFILYLNIKAYFQNRKISQKEILQIDQLLISNKIEVIQYKCKRAILFSEYEDEGVCYALELADNRLLFWWDIDHIGQGFLPSSIIEIYADEMMRNLLKVDIRPLGERFIPIVISPEIKWEIADLLPSHREIIDSNVDAFLQQIELELKK